MLRIMCEADTIETAEQSCEFIGKAVKNTIAK
jgi:hypothetical protein